MLGHSPLASAALGGTSLTHYTFIAGSASFTLGASSTNLEWGRRLVASSGSLALAGQASGLYRGLIGTSDSTTFELTGYSTAVAGAYEMIAGRSQFNLYGQDAGLYAGRNITAALGAYTLTTPDVGFRDDFQPIYGAYTLTGQAVTLRAARRITASGSTFTVVGIGPEGTVNASLEPEAGVFRLTSGETQFHFNYEIRRSITVSDVGFTYKLDDAITTGGR